MSIINHKQSAYFQDIPDENIEIASDFERMSPIDMAAVWHVFSLYTGVTGGRLDYMVELAKRCFSMGISWYKFTTNVPIKQIAMSCIPVANEGLYDPEDMEFALLAITAAVDWYIKRGEELC